MTRDPYFTSMQTTSPRSVANTNNASANNSFPPIGTFSLESTSPQPNHVFSQSDFFTTNSNQSNSMNGGINGGSNHSSGSSTIFNQTNNNSSNSGVGGTDPNGATRETGIIEKLLVGFFSSYNCFQLNFLTNFVPQFFLLVLFLKAALLRVHSMLRTSSTFVFSFFPVQW